ncbi:MAG: radical SAM protein [Candidatus Methanoperedens sp.]|nr:radical SAM protein [Candidatus Methanoperedens sp.]
MPDDRAKKIIDALDASPEIKASMFHAFTRKHELHGNDITFFKEPFTPISLTGAQCSLSCRHCNSHYLSHMLDGSGDKLYSRTVRLKEDGAKGILVSGGRAPDGSVPTYKYKDVIVKLKKDTRLKISAHTGIVNREQAQILSQYLDMALVDVPGDDETIQDILGLPSTVSDYEDSLKYLSHAGIPLAPHIIVGLHDGQLKGEMRALELVKKFDPEVVVLVIFIPTRGTAMEGIAPPDVHDVVRVITKAREMFDVPLSLSCVRPGGRYRSQLDMYAILSGMDRIAVPSMNAYKMSKELGLNIREIQKMCCSYRI